MINLHTKFKVSVFTTAKIQKSMQNVEIGWFGVSGHPRSPAVSPFDRAHTTSYSTLIETMRLSCTVF